MGAFIAPGLTDKVMDTTMFEAQREDFPNASHHNGLEHASGSLLERGGYSGHVAESSLYTKSVLHPFIAGGLFAAGLGLAYAATRALRNGSHLTTNADEFGNVRVGLPPTAGSSPPLNLVC